MLSEVAHLTQSGTTVLLTQRTNMTSSVDLFQSKILIKDLAKRLKICARVLWLRKINKASSSEMVNTTLYSHEC